MIERKCVHCGKPESEHHEFQAYPVPDGCKCHSDGSWAITNIPSVCKTYTFEGEDTVCVICEHDKACHEPA